MLYKIEEMKKKHSGLTPEDSDGASVSVDNKPGGGRKSPSMVWIFFITADGGCETSLKPRFLRRHQQPMPSPSPASESSYAGEEDDGADSDRYEREMKVCSIRAERVQSPTSFISDGAVLLVGDTGRPGPHRRTKQRHLRRKVERQEDEATFIHVTATPQHMFAAICS